MSYSDIASRIGAIQGTLARVGGASPTVIAVPRPKPLEGAPATALAGGSAAMPAGTGLNLDATSENSSTFTKALQEALAAPSAINQKKAVPERVPVPGPVHLTAPQNTKVKTESLDTEPRAKAGGVDGTDVVAAAREYLGVPYKWGGNNPKVGLDCSSFVQHTFRDLGVELPRVARQQAKEGTEVPSLAQAKPGDLIVTRGGGHIGIYLGENKMIHAPQPGQSVSIRKLFETDATIMTIRRIVPSNSSPGPGEQRPAAPAEGNREISTKQAELTAALERAIFSTAVLDA